MLRFGSHSFSFHTFKLIIRIIIMICLFTKMFWEFRIKYPRNNFLKVNGAGEKWLWNNVLWVWWHKVCMWFIQECPRSRTGFWSIPVDSVKQEPDPTYKTLSWCCAENREGTKALCVGNLKAFRGPISSLVEEVGGQTWSQPKALAILIAKDYILEMKWVKELRIFWYIFFVFNLRLSFQKSLSSIKSDLMGVMFPKRL